MKLMFTSLVLSLAASALAAEPHITLPIPDGTFTGTVGRTFRESSPASLPKPVASAEMILNRGRIRQASRGADLSKRHGVEAALAP